MEEMRLCILDRKQSTVLGFIVLIWLSTVGHCYQMRLVYLGHGIITV